MTSNNYSHGHYYGWDTIIVVVLLGLIFTTPGSIYGEGSNPDLHKWGTYRPQVYAGLRTRTTTAAVLTGLMWYNADDPMGWKERRHKCSMDDNLRYAWNRHNGRDFGQQSIEDMDNNVRIRTEYVHLQQEASSSSPSASGSNDKPNNETSGWAFRVHVDPLQPAATKPRRIAMLYYAAIETHPDASNTTADDMEHLHRVYIPRVKGKKPRGVSSQGGRSFVLHGEAPQAHIPAFSMIVQGKHRGEGGPTRTAAEKDDSGRETPSGKPIDNWHFLVDRVDSGADVWQAEETIAPMLQRSWREESTRMGQRKREGSSEDDGNDEDDDVAIVATLPNVGRKEGNLAVVQRILEVPFTLDVVYYEYGHHHNHANNTSSEEYVPPPQKQHRSYPHPFTSSAAIKQEKRIASSLRLSLSSIVSQAENDFDNRFEETFRLQEQGYGKREIRTAQHALSSLLGGIGFFYGSALHKEGDAGQVQETRPYSLLTGCPSRSFFPRGFLWDEGFHQLLVQRWDRHLSREILRTWFNAMQPSGWIPREQILGPEPRSRVPGEFQVQHPDHGNPPTLLLPLRNLAVQILESMPRSAYADSVPTPHEYGMEQRSLDDRVPLSSTNGVNDPGNRSASTSSPTSSMAEDISFLRDVLPRCVRFYRWFCRTQQGKTAGTYRWRGRTEHHTLSSGLDDYPRGTPHPRRTERHLDLYGWIYTMADTLRLMAYAVGESNLASEMESDAQQLRQNLFEYHWDSKNGRLADYVGVPRPRPEHGSNIDWSAGEFSERKGYISLFPFLTGLINATDKGDNHKALRSILNMMKDKRQLWSGYGLRSLSISDPLHGTREDYWRGAVWFNINYLSLRALYRNAMTLNESNIDMNTKLSSLQKELQSIYTDLRRDLIKTIHKEYVRTGFFWEQYGSHDGIGRRTHPFTGWTTLIVLAMAEMY